MNTSKQVAWLEIDLGAIKNNLHQMQSITGKPILAVVKANAYGHGLVPVARAVFEAGAAWCGVARMDEALALRAGGVDGSILVLGYTPQEDVAQAIAQNITLNVYDPEIAQSYHQAALQAGRKIKVHAKIDTGMGRLGVFAEDGVEYIRFLRSLSGLELEGMFTHFSRADEQVGVSETERQIARFNTLLDSLESSGLRPPLVHAANSAGLLYFPTARFDMVRAGIALYGLNPSSETPVPANFRTALSLKARLHSVKILPAHHGVGYNHRYITSGEERIGVFSAGYADGIRRKVGNVALVRGKRVPILGTPCMDQCMINLDSVPDAQFGDEVVLLGVQGEEQITADDLAAAWGTTNYEVVCGMANRVPRIYRE